MRDGATPRRGGRWLRNAVLGMVGLLVIAYAAIGWYVSGEIINGLRVTAHVVEYDTDVLVISPAQITLDVPDKAVAAADRDAVMGLRWEGGYGQLGPAAEVDGTVETRPFTLLEGQPPPVGSDLADLDGYAFPDDPGSLGLEVETVSYTTPLGPVESWFFPGEHSTWIVAVHGRGADRTEHLRLVDATRHLGHPTLIIRYRNDPDSPQTGDSLIRVGQDEYADVAAAVDYALANGAADVVVAGASMGGGLSLSYALEEPRDVVRGLILEGPAADLREIVQRRSGEGLPVGGPVGESLLAVGRWVTSLRIGVDFDAVDYVDRAGELDVPVLLLHGVDDTTVPHAISENLAAARPDLVEFHSIPDAEHIRAWNEDPEQYADTVAAFLTRVGG